jgi:hypothetical protein
MRPSFFSDNEATLSQKAIFNSKEYLDSFNKSFLCYLKKTAEPDSGPFSNISLFLSIVYDNVLAKFFLTMNFIFGVLSSYLPESLIMLLCGSFGFLIWIALFAITAIVSLYYHIINIPQLFRTSSENKWEASENISFLRFIRIILLVFLWWLIPLSSFLITVFVSISGMFSPLFATYRIKNKVKKDNKGAEIFYNFLDFIKDTFVYKKFFFLILATISLFRNGVNYLGSNAIVGILIAVIFAYLMGLYSNEMPESGNDGFSVGITQNIAHAKVKEVNIKNLKEPIQLVEICKPIPTVDEEVENIIKNGKFRNLNNTEQIQTNNDSSDNKNVVGNTQTGGKKRNKSNHTKKYHIRLT